MNDTATVSTNVVPLRWSGTVDEGHLEMLDQRQLPAEEVWEEMTTEAQVAEGIRAMKIRGAPAIGIAAAYAVALGFRERGGAPSTEEVAAMFESLRNTRPTAVNLFWALRRMKQRIDDLEDADAAFRVEKLFEEAAKISQEDRNNNLRIALHGVGLFKESVQVLTHCNTGGLATGGVGTALGVVRALHADGKLEHVWVDETRPYLQGARLTAWECMRDEIPCTLITDSMAGHFMKDGLVDAVIVGTDRVTANGDVANKIGTYGLAVLALHHGIPFYVAAPVSTIDLETPSGAGIEIEQRSDREVTHVHDIAIAPDGVPVAHPAFDVTPADLVTGIVTQWGVAEPPYHESLPPLVERGA